MSKYINAALVFLYVVLTIFCFLLLLVLSGVRISDLLGWSIVVGWVVLCFCSAYVFTSVKLLLHGRLRRPTRAEEERLLDAFAEVRERAGYTRPVMLRVMESSDLNAFSTGTRIIAVSKGLLATLSDEELKGVLAHELGHLKTYDTVVAEAFMTAGMLPRIIRIMFRVFTAMIRIRFLKSYKAGILALIILGILLYYAHLLSAVIPVILFVVLFEPLKWIYRILLLLLSRLAEYRQDAFAQRLGYGTGLRQVLERLAEEKEQDMSAYFIMFRATHPIIYNRIRRLEKLEGAPIAPVR